MKPLPSFTTDVIKELDRSYINNVGDLSPHVDDKKLWMLIGQRKLIDALKRRARASNDIENDLNQGTIQLINNDNDNEGGN